MVFNFDRTIKLSDLFMSASILISAMTLVLTLSKDHAAREQQRANEVRAASARTLESLERWRTITLSFFDEMPPIFLEISATSITPRDKDKTVAALIRTVQQKIIDREKL